MGVHRGYEGIDHDLDAGDLSDDDLEIQKQNQFEHEMQQKIHEQATQEYQEQLKRQEKMINDLKTHQNEPNDDAKSIGCATEKHPKGEITNFLEDSESES